MNLFSFLIGAIILAKIFGIMPVAAYPWWILLAPLWMPLIVIAVGSILAFATGGRR